MRTRASDSLFIPAPRLNRINILNEVGTSANLSQAELARRCGLSVAMVNNYMKELAQSGLLQYNRHSSKTISYHLTDAGRTEVKSAHHMLLQQTIELYRKAKAQIRGLLLSEFGGRPCRVLLCGSGDLAELAFHALEATNARVIGICDEDPARTGRDWCGREVVGPAQFRYTSPDLVLVADQLPRQAHAGLNCFAEGGARLVFLDSTDLEPVGPDTRVPGFMTHAMSTD